jgi:hypothetical protein
MSQLQGPSRRNGDATGTGVLSREGGCPPSHSVERLPCRPADPSHSWSTAEFCHSDQATPRQTVGSCVILSDTMRSGARRRLFWCRDTALVS